MDYIDEIYYSMQGLMDAGAEVPWVENIMHKGSCCDRAYEEMMDARDRLCRRLGVAEDDADLEVMLNSMLQLQRELCRAMFIHGMKFCNMEQEAPA